MLSSNNLRGFSTIQDDVLSYEIVTNEGQLAIFSFDKIHNTFPNNPYNTRDPFIATLTKDNTLSLFALGHLFKKGFGQNTILAYAYEAASSSQEQAFLVKNLFSQIVRIYKEHENVIAQMRDYMMLLGKSNDSVGQVPQLVLETTERLFGSHERALMRLEELAEKLQENQQVTVNDLYDMGIYALPFNLQYIAQRMQLAYRMHQASTSANNL